MRNYLLAMIVGLAGLTVGAAVIVLGRHTPPQVPAATTAPSESGEAVVSLPPASEPASSPGAKVASPATPSPQPETATTAVAAAPDLPSVDIAPHPVHTVPNNDDTPAPTVTLQDRNGRTIKEIKPAPGLSPTYVPSVGPGSARSFASTAPSYAPPPSGPVMVPPIPG